ncbi:MAG: hypothetical protein LKF82_10725 [Acinetobacter populi]|jgi:DNA-directed RNA polymerase|uniref:hypothetical protein n=1 Tax=Acinetobacter populi TaxID=1582270 RepID=UPI002355474A|nr:hypothetical protein [Acinetobacter populi]MCH4248283.1 hypothetical protein [Acinetobacter populi]
MYHYKRTILGTEELQQRRLRLSARARTLLLLLESDDLKQHNSEAYSKITSIENYQILLELGLIYAVETANSDQTSTTQHDTHISESETFIAQNNPASNETINVAENPVTQSVVEQPVIVEKIEQPVAEIVSELPILSFEEIKILMQQTLKQYAGLMAKNLIVAIENAKNIQEIKKHQSNWLTTLFETRISRQQLTSLMQHINQSIDQMN